MTRLRIKITGESGSGLLSTGEIITNALEEMGFNIVADREYPSLIKGGESCYTLNISTDNLWSLSDEADIMLALDKQSLEAYHPKLKKGGHLVHGYERLKGLGKILEQMDCEITHVMGRTVAKEQGGNVLMVNVVLIGVLWKVLGLPYKFVEDEVKKQFASKPALLEIDLRCLQAGYDLAETKFQIEIPSAKNDQIVINGNNAIALGAIHAGCRAYYAYPMSPASSILTYMAKYAKDTGVLVKQAEDEITASQMTLGSMYAGTRAMTATSGGGYDLMTETVSLAGITETPMVVCIAQRPGPGTGLPTWTAQADLHLAISSSHGEFARLVIAVADPSDAFDLIQHAFNYAEEFQIPVILLTEKVIAENLISIDRFEQNKIPIKRGLSTKEHKNEDRFAITESGISPRWVPGSQDAYYFANGDEHWTSGELTEDEQPSQEMYAKRIRKLETLKAELPEPVIYGNPKAKISFVGWGSTLNVMRDIIAENPDVNYLHYSYVFPLKTETLNKFFAENPNVHLAENNYMGQLGHYIQAETQNQFAGKLLKANGRPFFIEDLQAYINNQI